MTHENDNLAIHVGGRISDLRPYPLSRTAVVVLPELVVENRNGRAQEHQPTTTALRTGLG